MLSIKYLIVSLADAYSMVLFVYVLMSWFPTDRGILADSTECWPKCATRISTSSGS